MCIECNQNRKPDVVVYTCNSHTWETGAVGLPWVQCKLVLTTNLWKLWRGVCIRAIFTEKVTLYWILIFLLPLCVCMYGRSRTTYENWFSPSKKDIHVWNIGNKHLYLLTHLLGPVFHLTASIRCGRMGRDTYSGKRDNLWNLCTYVYVCICIHMCPFIHRYIHTHTYKEGGEGNDRIGERRREVLFFVSLYLRVSCSPG